MTNSTGKAGKAGGIFLLCFFFGASLSAAALMPAPKRLAVREVEVKTDAAAPFLSRPVAVVCDEGSVYVLDSADADIKIYSRDGAYRRTIGRKGQGPGEFRLPNDLDVFGGRLYVADSANRRLQILDADGEYVGGFPLGMTPWRILVLSDDRILVAGLTFRPCARREDHQLLPPRTALPSGGRSIPCARETRSMTP